MLPSIRLQICLVALAMDKPQPASNIAQIFGAFHLVSLLFKAASSDDP